MSIKHKLKYEFDFPVSKDIALQKSKVDAMERVQMLHQYPATIWITGLSGSGKSTLAFELEKQLFADNHLIYVLDGDNIRHGLNQDLGFSPKDRTENIRRVAEVAKLFNDAGLLVITSFIETWLSTSLDVCEQRDPKGLYKKARSGSITGFTGITAPYEVPNHPELRIDTSKLSIEECVSKIIDQLRHYTKSVF